MIQRLIAAVRSGDLVQTRSLLGDHPELVNIGLDGFQALHYAVLDRSPEMVRLLMESGASARAGIYPYRDATDAMTIATERGYREIVSIIEEAEQRRHDTHHRVAPEPGALTSAVLNNQPETLARLLDQGLDPDERTPVAGTDEPASSWGMPLWHCAGAGKYEMAEMLLQHGADPNGCVYASGSPMFQAYAEADQRMIGLLTHHGGLPEATSAGLFRQTELARQMLSGEAKFILDSTGGDTLAEQLLWGAACGGDPEIVLMALDRVDWPRGDARWFAILEQPLRVWMYGSASKTWDRSTYPDCFQLLVRRCDPNILGRFGLTILHSVAGTRPHVTAEERVSFASTLLDAGANLSVRDGVLLSTPLGWACRWGRVELVKLLLERGADPVEPDAQPWATPRAWAEKMQHDAVLAALGGPQ